MAPRQHRSNPPTKLPARKDADVADWRNKSIAAPLKIKCPFGLELTMRSNYLSARKYLQ
jgi:hypothetical protein